MKPLNINLPIMQEDEMYLSYIERVRFSNALSQEAFISLLGIGNLSINNLYTNIEVIKQLLNIKKSAYDLFYQNTTIRIYRFILSKEEQKEIDDDVLTGHYYASHYYEHEYNNRSCPICAKEETELYGSPIRKVYTSYGNVNACTKHNFKLAYYFNDYKELGFNKATEEEISYAKWIENLYRLNLNNICLENSRALCKVKLADYIFHRETVGKSGNSYRIGYHVNADKLRSFEVLDMLHLIYKDDFDTFIKDYKNIDYNEVYKEQRKYKCFG